MGQMRIVGTTKLKVDALCPYCKGVARPAQAEVEIIQDLDSGKQFATMRCNACGEQLLLR